MSEVLITGAKGIIGTVLTEGLNRTVRPFDLPEYDTRNYEQLLSQLMGCVAVIHLAWDTESDNFKSNYTNPDNYAMTQNVYRAAKESMVPRVIVASSIHADMPLQEPGGPRSPYRLPEPDSPYGASKVAMEALGRYYSRQDLEVIAVRFGWVGPSPADRPTGTLPPGEGWISHRDCASLISACLDAPAIQDNFVILHGLSRREGGGAHDLNNPLGWTPLDSYRVETA